MDDSNILYTRADGLSETSSGDLAVVMVKHSGKRGDEIYLRYRENFLTDPVEVSWDVNDSFCFFPAELATGLLRRGYAVPVSKALVDAWNEPLQAAVPKAPAKSTAAAAKSPPLPKAAAVEPTKPWKVTKGDEDA